MLAEETTLREGDKQKLNTLEEVSATIVSGTSMGVTIIEVGTVESILKDTSHEFSTPHEG